MAVLCSSVALPLACVLAACTRPAQGPLPGDSDTSFKPSERAVPISTTPRPPWDEYAEVRGWPAVNAAPFVSRGHPLAGAVEIHVSPSSQSAYLNLVPDTAFAEGSVLAELPAHAGAGHGFAMRKSADKWSFFELDAQGGLLFGGTLPLCAGCHAEAPSHGVFGLPRDPPARR